MAEPYRFLCDTSVSGRRESPQVDALYKLEQESSRAARRRRRPDAGRRRNAPGSIEMTHPKRLDEVEALIAEFGASGMRELHVRCDEFEIYLSTDPDAKGLVPATRR